MPPEFDTSVPPERGMQASRQASYPALLRQNIISRKSEFFVGLLLSVITSSASVWLQYRDGMLEKKHFWDGIVTSAVPVLGIIVVFALIELYRAAASLHREAQAEIHGLHAAMDAHPARSDAAIDRGTVLKLTTELDQFVAMRRTTQPPRQFIRASNVFGDISASELATASYLAQTAEIYEDRFLERVNNTRDALSRIGVEDPRLNQANINPALTDNIQAISDRLKEIANRLPTNPVNDVAALHQANTRLQNTIAVQDDKIAALERAAPRHLNDDARHRIVTHMRPLVERWTIANGQPPQMQVIYFTEGGDSFAYSNEFEETLTSVGFEMVIGRRSPHPKSADGVPDDFRQGVFILQDDEASSKASQPDFAGALWEALSESAIEVQKLNRTGVLLSLVVGARKT